MPVPYGILTRLVTSADVSERSGRLQPRITFRSRPRPSGDRSLRNRAHKVGPNLPRAWAKSRPASCKDDARTIDQLHAMDVLTFQLHKRTLVAVHNRTTG